MSDPKFRVQLADATRVAERFLAALPVRAWVAGSIRRLSPMVGDVDVVSLRYDEPGNLGFVSGGSRIRNYDFEGVRVNVFVTDPDSIGACLLFATGSGEFNVQMRARAKGMGLKLNQYGLFRNDHSRERVAGSTELSIFEALGETWVPPEGRGREGYFRVASVMGSTGNEYVVGLTDGRWSCTCPHHVYRGAICKHIEAVASSDASALVVLKGMG